MGGDLLGGLFGGGGGGLGGLLGGLPIIGGMFGGGGGQQGPTLQPNPGFGASGPANWGGWPVPTPGPTPSPQRFTGSLSDPGAAENYFAAHQNAWTGPGAASNWWGGNASGLNKPGAADQYWAGVAGRGNTAPPASTNYAADAYKQFQGSTPADTSSFYDRAVQNASRDIDRSAASRGQYGDSATMGALANSDANIRAQQAQENAQYGLSRAGLAGQLGAGADVSSRGNIANQLGWLTGMGGLGLGIQDADTRRLLGAGGLALGMDQNALARLNAGMGAANAAQDALTGRAQNFFNNNLAMGQANAAPMMQLYLQQLQNDQQLMDQQMQAALGYPREGLNQSITGRASSEQGIGNLFGLFGKVAGMGGISGMGDAIMNGR